MRIRRKLAVVTTGVALLIASTAVASSAQNPTPHPDLDTTGAAVSTMDEQTQLTENGVATARTDLSATGATAATNATGTAAPTTPKTLCDTNARWLRPRVTALDLHGNDTVTLTGSAGGTYTLTAANWPGKAFHTRAFPGSCLTVTPHLADPASRYAVDSYQYGTTDLANASVTVAGAGDICGTACNQTDDLIASINPVAVYTAGDNAYESGTLSEFNNNYNPTWGQFKAKTYPAPGNHEYNTSGASGYFDYFNGVGNATGRAGERGKGYYSYDVGDWHFIVLNTDITHSAGSTQEKWLRADLAANTKPCTAAYTHHPRFSSGDHGDDTSVGPFFQALYDYHADLLMYGHDHHYERFAPAKPDGTVDNANGLRSLLIGTGGRALYTAKSTSAGPSEVFNNNTFGVGKFQLTATGYTMDFVPVAGRTFTDHVTGNCHNAAKTPDFGVTANPASVAVTKGGNAGTTTVSVASSGGFNSAVALSASGLPAGVTASFNPASVTPPANGSVTSTLSLGASSSTVAGTYTVTVTATGGGLPAKTVPITLTVGSATGSGFTDDFEADKGWTVNPAGTDTATTGKWERGAPEQTTSTYSNQVKQLGTTPSGANCLSTGRLAGSAYGANDLDGGVTSVRSTAFTVPTGATLAFKYSVAHGDNSSADDYLRISVVSGSTVTTVWQKTGAAAEVAGAWQSGSVDLSAYAGQNVTLLVSAADAAGGSLFEAQLDDIAVTGTA